MPEDDLSAFVALLRSQAIAADRLAGFAEEAGSAIELLRLVRDGRVTSSSGELALDTVPDAVIEASQRDVDAWRASGLDVRTVFDPTYPANLHEVANRPPFVFVRGGWDEAKDSRAVAVVGTREASDEGIRRARRLAKSLAGAGITVVSGLARGIDEAAHTAAIEAGGRTTAVLGHGLSRVVYPAEHAPLAAAIERHHGALISQFLPEQPPARWTFPKRNVVMSGLSWATVVVEAGYTSGARIQATEALRHGRTVFLLRSLVESHRWAAEYVSEGKHGARAIVLDDPSELLDALDVASAA